MFRGMDLFGRCTHPKWHKAWDPYGLTTNYDKLHEMKELMDVSMTLLSQIVYGMGMMDPKDTNIPNLRLYEQNWVLDTHTF